MKEIKDYISELSSLLPLGKSISYTEAEKRSSQFLSGMAAIADWKHVLVGEKIKLLSIQAATYSQELNKGTGKTITENKITVEASEEYIKAREDLESIDNDISYLKTYYEIFMNASVFYRQIAKGESL